MVRDTHPADSIGHNGPRKVGQVRVRFQAGAEGPATATQLPGDGGEEPERDRRTRLLSSAVLTGTYGVTRRASTVRAVQPLNVDEIEAAVDVGPRPRSKVLPAGVSPVGSVPTGFEPASEAREASILDH